MTSAFPPAKILKSTLPLWAARNHDTVQRPQPMREYLGRTLYFDSSEFTLFTSLTLCFSLALWVSVDFGLAPVSTKATLGYSLRESNSFNSLDASTKDAIRFLATESFVLFNQ